MDNASQYAPQKASMIHVMTGTQEREALWAMDLTLSCTDVTTVDS